MNNLNTATSVAVISNAAMTIAEIKKRFPNNKTLGQDIKTAFMITVIGLIISILLSIIPLFRS